MEVGRFYFHLSKIIFAYPLPPPQKKKIDPCVCDNGRMCTEVLKVCKIRLIASTKFKTNYLSK